MEAFWERLKSFEQNVGVSRMAFGKAVGESLKNSGENVSGNLREEILVL